MVMMATSSRESGCWDSLGCPCGIFFEPLEADTKIGPFWPVTPEPAPQRQSERTLMTLTHPLLVYWG